MTAYLAGALLGRLLISYLLVASATRLLFYKLRFRDAMKHVHRPYGWLAILIVFTGGIHIAVMNGQGV